MRSFTFYTFLALLLSVFCANGQPSSTVVEAPKPQRGNNYLMELVDARLDVGLKTNTIFALDDRAPLSSNPHFQAMWDLIRLGAALESILAGTEEPLNDINLDKQFGQNGYNRTVIMFFARYGFGESSDVKIQQHFFELGISQGFFKEGNGGMNIHLDYRTNIAKTNYGAGGNSIDRAIDYEIFAGMRVGFDWSSGRSESEAGFFAHLNEEIKRIAAENELSVSQLLMLEQLAESSKVLLPEDVGGRAFHIGPIAGARISKKITKNFRCFVGALGFYDLMDLSSSNKDRENRRSQHQISIMAGVSLTIGGEGGVVSFF